MICEIKYCISLTKMISAVLQVSIDGKSILDINLLCLRNEVGFVQQKTALFGVTIFESICHGLPNITLNDVIHIARDVRAHESIIKLPKVRSEFVYYNYCVILVY